MKRKNEFGKFLDPYKEKIDNTHTGKTYGTGVAFKKSKKLANEKLTTAARNPRGIPTKLMRCAYYYPLESLVRSKQGV